MFSVFDDIVSNAIGVEVHNRNKVGYKPDPTLNAVYVLIGAFNDGKYIVPVKLEIKEFNDKENVLYVAVALEKVKATEVSGQGNTNNGVTQNSRSVAKISLAQLFRKINPNDKEFAKYIPDEFLENKQIEAKAQTLFEESKRLVREKPLVQKYSDSGKEFNDPNKRFSKDDTIFDDFADEVMFTADGDIAFDGFGADAQRTIDVKELVQEQGAAHSPSNPTFSLKCFIYTKRHSLRNAFLLAETVGFEPTVP